MGHFRGDHRLRPVMLKLKRLAWAVPLAAVASLVNVPLVSADNGVTCDSSAGNCFVAAEAPGSSGGTSSPNGGRGSHSNGGQASGSLSGTVGCEARSDGARGQMCLTAPSIGGGAPAPPSPAEVAQQAVELLPLGAPDIRLAPPSSGLVGVPVWMWVQTSEETWGPISRTASVRGVSVTATAQASRVVWDMGDGTTVTCHSPGTPYTPDQGAKSSPDCGHNYTAPSTSQAGGRYRITATTHWSIRWSGSASGSDAMTRTSTAWLAIGEAQALTQ